MSRARPWLLATLAYALGAVAFTWPLAPSLGTHVWGDRFDAWTTMWLIWHLQDALASGQLTEVTDRILYPVGYNLWSFGHLGIQLIGVPLMWLGVGLVATYNLLVLGSFVFSALCAHLFGRHLGGSHAAGALAAAAFTWTPYLYGEMSAGCVELVAAGFIPLFAWMLLRLCDRPGWSRAWPAILLFAAIGPFNWYYTLFTGLFTVAFAAWRWLAGGERRTRTVAWIALVCVAAAALDAPLIPKVRRETPSRTVITAETFSTENWQQSYAVSNARVPLEALDVALLELNDAMQVVVNSTSLINLTRARFTANPLDSTPGALAYVLGLIGLVAAGRRGRGWAVMAAGFTVLTLGPFLQIDATPPLADWAEQTPLPYYWLYNEVPFFSKAYRPYRLGVVVLVCLGGLAAGGARSQAWSLAALAGVLGPLQPHLSGERPADRPLADATIPPIYDELAALPDGAVIELPLLYQPISPANARFQYHQVAHRKPVLNCNQLIRRTDLLAFQDYVGENAFLQTVLDLGRRSPPYAFRSDDLHELADQGFRYVIVHPAFETSQLHLSGFHGEADRLGQVALQMLAETFGEPVLRSEDTWVYAFPDPLPPPGTRFAWSGDAVLDVPVPWSELKLPVTLQAGEDLLLDWPEGASQARALSLWVHRPEASPGDGRLVVAGAGVVDTTPGTWTRVALPLTPGTVPVLRAEGGSVTVELDRLQLVREAG